MAYDETLVQEETLTVQVKHVVLTEGQTCLIHDGEEVRASFDGPADVMCPAEYDVGIGTKAEVVEAISAQVLLVDRDIPIAVEVERLDAKLIKVAPGEPVAIDDGQREVPSVNVVGEP
jgi:hypothetical protein